MVKRHGILSMITYLLAFLLVNWIMNQRSVGEESLTRYASVVVSVIIPEAFLMWLYYIHEEETRVIAILCGVNAILVVADVLLYF